MASISSFSVLVFLFVFFANSQVLISTADQPTTTPARPRPAVLPYVTAPNISSFFPHTTGADYGPSSSAASPESEAPALSSGEFDGKRFSSSTRLDCSAAIVGILLISSFLATSMIV